MRRTKSTFLVAAVALLVAASVGASNLTVVSPGLSSETSAACPTGCKLAVNMDPANVLSFVISDQPNGETVFRAEFWLWHNNIFLPTAPVKTVRILEVRKDKPAARVLAFASIFYRLGTYRINFMAHNDDNSIRPIGGFVLGNGGPSRFILEWAAASGPGTNDGYLRVSKGPAVKEKTDYDYYNGGSGVDQVRFGHVRATDLAITETFYLDTYSSFRTLAP